MKTLNEIRQNYDYGFISQRELVLKVTDTLTACGLSMKQDFLCKLCEVENAERHIRKAYEGKVEDGELESLLSVVYGPLVPEVYELIDKLD